MSTITSNDFDNNLFCGENTFSKPIETSLTTSNVSGEEITTLNTGPFDIIIDFQGVKSSGCSDVIIREICFISIGTGKGEVVKLKLPVNPYTLSKDIRKEWSYYGDCWHKIPLTAGDVHYNALSNYAFIIKMSYSRILTKGEQKRIFLESFFEMPAVNIENFSAPNFRALSEMYPNGLELCDFHKRINSYFCSKYKAGLIYLWSQDNDSALLVKKKEKKRRLYN